MESLAWKSKSMRSVLPISPCGALPTRVTTAPSSGTDEKYQGDQQYRLRCKETGLILAPIRPSTTHRRRIYPNALLGLPYCGLGAFSISEHEQDQQSTRETLMGLRFEAIFATMFPIHQVLADRPRRFGPNVQPPNPHSSLNSLRFHRHLCMLPRNRHADANPLLP